MSTPPAYNIETWYCLNRSTPPLNFYEADDFLNTQVIFTRAKKDEVSNNGFTSIPIPTISHVIIAATKIYTVTQGTLSIVVKSTSSATITVYVQRLSTSSVISTYTLSGSAMASLTLQLSMVASDGYLIILTQYNSTINNTLFIQTGYTGVRLPRNKGYVGNVGYVVPLSTSSLVSVADYKWSARTADFDGWLLCDGRAIYRNAYASLFAIIGTSFGAGDGSTTFNIPDCRGRVGGALSSSRPLGQMVGEETHVLSVSEMPTHDHTGTVSTVGNHTHSASTGNAGGHTHTFQDAYFAENPPGGNVLGSSGGTDYDNGYVYRNGVTDAVGDHTHSVSVASAGSHSHSVTIANMGNGAAHNNLQPTIFMGNLFICAEA